MERIQLKMEAQSKYETIKSLVDHKNCSDFTSSKKRAAVQLNCTLRTINRWIKRYEANGKSALSMATVAGNLLTLSPKNEPPKF